MKILYYGYSSCIDRAPHQEMAMIHLARLGHSVEYICWGGVGMEPSVSHKNMAYLPVPKAGMFSAIRLLGKLLSKLVFSNEFDVVYIQGAQQTPFLFWLPVFKGRKRLIYHTQDYLEPRRHKFYERFERIFARHADYVVCNEVNRARFMKSYYGLSHTPVVLRTALPFWWEVPSRSEETRDGLLTDSGVEDTEKAIVIVAGGPYRTDRMSPQLLEAFARLPNNFVLVFNGSAMEPEKGCRLACEYHMKKLGVSERVVFRGGLTFKELLALYSIGEVGILLYPNDGVGHFYQCPGRFSEYLRSGLSLVSSNFPGLELLTLKYELGAVCDPEDPHSITTALLEVGKKAKTQRAEILEVAEREFVYEATAGVLEEILEGTYKHFKPSVTT